MDLGLDNPQSPNPKHPHSPIPNPPVKLKIINNI